MRAEQARQIPIAAFLERAGIKPAKVTRQGRELWYSSPLRAGDSDPSFKVDTVHNLWFDHGIARGGNVIDLVIEMRRVTVKEALAILGSGFAGSVPATRPIADKSAPAGEKENERGFTILDTGVLGHPALVKYVSERRIPSAVARRWLHEIRFRPKGSLKKFFAVGFPCGDGYDVRSPVFKGFVGTTKDITRLSFAGQGTVVVFEGAFDFLTWLAMRELETPDCGVIILHSTSLRRRGLEAITTHGFGRVKLYLDHDQAGREAVAYFQSELGNRNVVDCSDTYRGFKDLNEWRTHNSSSKTS